MILQILFIQLGSSKLVEIWQSMLLHFEERNIEIEIVGRCKMLLQTLTKVLHRYSVYWEMEIKGNEIEDLFLVDRE